MRAIVCVLPHWMKPACRSCIAADVSAWTLLREVDGKLSVFSLDGGVIQVLEHQFPTFLIRLSGQLHVYLQSSSVEFLHQVSGLLRTQAQRFHQGSEFRHDALQRDHWLAFPFTAVACGLLLVVLGNVLLFPGHVSPLPRLLWSK